MVSDYNAIDQLVAPARNSSAPVSTNDSGQVKTGDYKKCIEISINAGMDMVMVTDKYRDFIRLLQELVHEGKVPISRIDDAVMRILRVKKHARGLLGKDAIQPVDPALQNDFGSIAHRAVARQAVQQSLFLLKNDGKVLPLSGSGPGGRDRGGMASRHRGPGRGGYFVRRCSANRKTLVHLAAINGPDTHRTRQGCGGKDPLFPLGFGLGY